MRRKRVESSMLRSVGYDAKQQVLEVEFHHGRIYQYLDVDEQTYRELIEAPSIGTYFNGNIRDNYENVRVR